LCHIANFISRFEIALSVVTFSHDGLRDSLTHLAAPPYFYENLRRELATAERNKSRLTLIRFQLFPIEERPATTESEENEIQQSIYEVTILTFAELLKSNTRAEDLCARLGRFEFTLILRAGEDVARSLLMRVLQQWENETFACKSSFIPAKLGESSLEILNRLDNQELRGLTIGS
jgi:GGDEF domain-containing protein